MDACSLAAVVRALAVSDEEVIDFVNRPAVFVPGNHDPDVSGFSKHAGLSLRPGPAGFVHHATVLYHQGSKQSPYLAVGDQGPIAF
jgi:hypothetical protein